MLKYEVEPRRGYLYVTLSGELTVPDAQGAYSGILQAAARQKLPRILLDCTRLTGTWEQKHRLAFGAYMAGEQNRMLGQFEEPPRVALLAAAPLMDPGRFTQTVANNRGVRARSSDDLQELLSWLEV